MTFRRQAPNDLLTIAALDKRNDSVTMKIAKLAPDLLYKMEAYRRAANYRSVGRFYL